MTAQTKDTQCFDVENQLYILTFSKLVLHLTFQLHKMLTCLADLDVEKGGEIMVELHVS